MGKHCIDPSVAKTAVAGGWQDAASIKDMVPIPGTVQWCKDMVTHGARLVLCTSDSRCNAEQGLKAMGIESLFDTLLCGDDEEYAPKPAATNLVQLQQRITKEKIALSNNNTPTARAAARLRSASQTTMVGDSPLDVLMGANAGALATIGVLTGVGDKVSFIFLPLTNLYHRSGCILQISYPETPYRKIYPVPMQ